ncbi:MAG: hypothetical protein R3236_01425, partial [Phycisphaeraceae bacterium]|nr:hypothetical protein [Phycisphaeraceae bacterium]
MRQTGKRTGTGLVTIGCLALIAAVVQAQQEEPKDPSLTAEQQAALIKKLAPSLVTVEIMLKYDQGEAPQGARIGHGGGQHYYRGLGAERLIREERPLLVSGWLIGPKRVALPDVALHRRFIDSIRVRRGGPAVAAAADGLATDRPGLMLALEKPLPDTQPLTFDPKAEGPYLTLFRFDRNGQWQTTLKPLGSAVTAAGAQTFYQTNPMHLVINREGVAVALPLLDRLPVDGSWKKSPKQWDTLTQDQYTQVVEKTEKQTDATILRVTMNFRSPKGNQQDRGFRRGDEESATERHALGLVMADRKTILVLASLKPKTTARLERIRVYHDGKAFSATFAGSVKEYGALLVTLKKPIQGDGHLRPAEGDLLDLRHRMLIKSQIRLAGKQRIAHHGHDRIMRYGRGYRGKVYPSLTGEDENSFVFDTEGRLVALPMVRRRKVAVRERWSDEQETLTPAAHIAHLLKDAKPHLDPNNVPLNETQENRIAWMGVVLQPLNRELARANGVSEQTKDGDIGGLVTWVYDGSPAKKAGIEQGMILVRLHVSGQPKPVDVKLEDRWFSFSGVFPWDRLDQFPVQVFERAPTPWPPTENSFTRKLTDLGFGKKYEAELMVDGQVVRKPMVVVQSPTHYQTAPKFKSEPLGLTVRDMTFEVRRQLQKKTDDPGVVISRIEPGSKTAVAGIKPFEVITHVNKKPVMNVQDFEKAVNASGPSLQFSVNRLLRTR